MCRIIIRGSVGLLMIFLSISNGNCQTNELPEIGDTTYFQPGEDDWNLIESVKRNEAGNVHLLLNRGANPDVRSEEDITALMYAIDSSKILIMRLLLVNGADPDLAYYEKTTPLILAVLNNQFDAVQLLLEKGADPDIIDDYKAAALHYAAASNFFQIADLLIYFGANKEIRDKDGNDPLITAVYFGNIETTDVLLQNGLEPDITDKNGNTPLMIAAQQGNTEIADLLLEYGANVNAVNNNNYSPLALAISNQQPEIVSLLISKGADVNHSVTTNRNLLDIAEQLNNSEIEKALKEKGAKRSVKPDFSEISLSWGNSIGSHELMMQVRGAWIDRRYGVYAETGVDWRPVTRKVQIRENDTLIFQYRESRIGWSLGIGKKFTYKPANSNMEFGLYGSVNGLLSFPDHKGIDDAPPVQYNIVPAAGMLIGWRFAGLKMGVERYQFKTIYEKPWKFNISLYLKFSCNNNKQDYKEIYY